MHNRTNAGSALTRNPELSEIATSSPATSGAASFHRTTRSWPGTRWTSAIALHMPVKAIA